MGDIWKEPSRERLRTGVGFCGWLPLVAAMEVEEGVEGIEAVGGAETERFDGCIAVDGTNRVVGAKHIRYNKLEIVREESNAKRNVHKAGTL